MPQKGGEMINYKASDIVSVYKHKEFKEIPPVKLHDFIPRIRANVPKEVQELETWKNHFRGVGAPFIVIKSDTYDGNKRERVPSLVMIAEMKQDPRGPNDYTDGRIVKGLKDVRI